MSIESTDLESLYEGLAPLAEPMGFTEVAELPTVDDFEAPGGSRLWSSSYARLLVCPMPKNVGETEFEQRFESAQQWLDELLLEHEERGAPLDGYLVLLLVEPPGPFLEARIRDIELDTSYCRKHVLWPEGEGWDRQLEKVTVLALVDTPSPAEPAILPELPERISEIWEMSSEGNSIRSLTEHVLSAAGLRGTGVPDED